MNTHHLRRNAVLALALAALVAAAFAGPAEAQPPVTVPFASQAAQVTQTVGLTEMTVKYHRPLVNDREVWGALVPYGQVWRAGANDNTTISFTHDVLVEGKPLAAGTYGLHMVPGETEWIVAFSKNHTSWGSFSYDEAEDALRVTVSPAPAPFREALTYDFQDVGPESTTLALRWAELAVPIDIAVADLHETVLANARNEMRHVQGFSWQGPMTAAAYAAANKVGLEEALAWADQAVQAEARFETYQAKSQVLAAMGRQAEADAAMALALDNPTNPNQLHFYARGLLGQGDVDGALVAFTKNRDAFPDNWVPHVGLARAQSAKGDYTAAATTMKKAQELAPEAQKTYLQGLIDQLEAGTNIN